MSKVLREVLLACSEYEVEVLNVWRGAKHTRLAVRASDGRTYTLTAPISPSDHRAMQNVRKHVRHFSRGWVGKPRTEVDG